MPSAFFQRKISTTSQNNEKKEIGSQQESFVDNRESTDQITQLQNSVDNSLHSQEITQLQEKVDNTTRMPDDLKQGIEKLSGEDMSDVKVTYNSDKPAQLQAHAYAQGNNIQIAPGQEKHLPHEAWHVAQQKQGRVQPTAQFNGAPINNDNSLESEADKMGQKALQSKSEKEYNTNKSGGISLPLKDTIQRLAIKEKDKPEEEIKADSVGFTNSFLSKHVAEDEEKAKKNTISRQESKKDRMGSINTVAKSESWKKALDESRTPLIVEPSSKTPMVQTTQSMTVWQCNIEEGSRKNRLSDKDEDTVSVNRDGKEVKKKGSELKGEEWSQNKSNFISDKIEVKEETKKIHFTAKVLETKPNEKQLLINHTGK